MQVLSGLATEHLHAHLQVWVLGVAIVEALCTGTTVPRILSEAMLQCGSATGWSSSAAHSTNPL